MEYKKALNRARSVKRRPPQKKEEKALKVEIQAKI